MRYLRPLLLRPRLLPRLSPRLPHRSTTTLPPSPPSPPPHSRLARRIFAPVSAFFVFYGASQRAHPWITQIATSTTINAFGDVNAQLLSPPITTTAAAAAAAAGDYDYFRTLRMTLTGALLAIPVNTWYTRISYCFSTLPRMAAVALQVGLSQAIFTPFFLIAFFGVQGTLEGRTMQEIKEKIVGTGPRAWRDGLVLWPAVSTVNFALVPLEYRALVGGVASLGWNTWLSYLNSRAGKVAVMEEEEVVVVAGGAPVVELKVGAAAVATPA